VNARIEWAARLIRAAGKPIPRYGTPDWQALAEGSPAKIAAVVVAAESWAREGDELEERLRAEVEMSRVAFKADEDADYCARRDAHRESWTGRGFRSDPRMQGEIETEWRDWMNGAAS
jgi:hypothetical protein